jgi:predicted MPP superfamily phosphohydrolase
MSNIGATEEAVAYMEGKGISFLRDTAVLLPQGVWLVGREDRDMPRFTGNNRLPLHEVMKKVQSDHPVILLDHQPYELEEKSENGVFLTLSGHTHHGQLWPLNYITQAIYGLAGVTGNMERCMPMSRAVSAVGDRRHKDRKTAEMV